mmetsp:Transcript_22164/g.33616  ORF Transcript_22164/g.33616 Transcript_22164/m.33616 type:complete len:179 (-) Transcript_22164:1438-1974(-)
MIAPRKKLWSTPKEVVKALIEWVPLKQNDVIYDVGCGDAKVLLEWAENVSASGQLGPVRFIGTEIDENRAKEAEENIKCAFEAGRLNPSIVSVEIHCKNALETGNLFYDATVVFLYLIPRGLRIVKPLLLEAAKSKAKLQVVSYMSPLPDTPCIAQKNCEVPHQPGAAWPLFLYHLEN